MILDTIIAVMIRRSGWRIVGPLTRLFFWLYVKAVGEKRWWAYLIGVPYDILYNLIVAWRVFSDRPREFFFTNRLKRYRQTEPDSWRGLLAKDLCDEVLDGIDPDGDHC